MDCLVIQTNKQKATTNSIKKANATVARDSKAPTNLPYSTVLYYYALL